MKLKKDILNIITCFTEDYGIGFKNTIPWKITGDLKFVKKLTTSQKNVAVVMGRKTFESLGNPLRNRTNVVITSANSLNSECTIYFRSFHEAIEYLKNHDYFIVIFGGTNIYSEALTYKYKIFYTIIHSKYVCDTFFPNHNFNNSKNISKKVFEYINSDSLSNWKLIENKFYENNIYYSFFTFKN